MSENMMPELTLNPTAAETVPELTLTPDAPEAKEEKKEVDLQ